MSWSRASARQHSLIQFVRYRATNNVSSTLQLSNKTTLCLASASSTRSFCMRGSAANSISAHVLHQHIQRTILRLHCYLMVLPVDLVIVKIHILYVKCPFLTSIVNWKGPLICDEHLTCFQAVVLSQQLSEYWRVAWCHKGGVGQIS